RRGAGDTAHEPPVEAVLSGDSGRRPRAGVGPAQCVRWQRCHRGRCTDSILPAGIDATSHPTPGSYGLLDGDIRGGVSRPHPRPGRQRLSQNRNADSDAAMLEWYVGSGHAALPGDTGRAATTAATTATAAQPE